MSGSNTHVIAVSDHGAAFILTALHVLKEQEYHLLKKAEKEFLDNLIHDIETTFISTMKERRDGEDVADRGD